MKWPRTEKGCQIRKLPRMMGLNMESILQQRVSVTQGIKWKRRTQCPCAGGFNIHSCASSTSFSATASLGNHFWRPLRRYAVMQLYVDCLMESFPTKWRAH